MHTVVYIAEANSEPGQAFEMKLFQKLLPARETNLESCQTYKKGFFAKIVKTKPLTIYAKTFLLDVDRVLNTLPNWLLNVR